MHLVKYLTIFWYAYSDLSLLFCFGTCLCDAQGLFTVLCSEITPDDALGTIGMLGIEFRLAVCKKSSLHAVCTISPAPDPFFHFKIKCLCSGVFVWFSGVTSGTVLRGSLLAMLGDHVVLGTKPRYPTCAQLVELVLSGPIILDLRYCRNLPFCLL